MGRDPHKYYFSIFGRPPQTDTWGWKVEGSRFPIEYDNVQNGANHIHTVWRDFDGDFGRDILREHFRAAHH